MKSIMVNLPDDLHAQMQAAKGNDSFQTFIEKVLRRYFEEEVPE